MNASSYYYLYQIQLTSYLLRLLYQIHFQYSYPVFLGLVSSLREKLYKQDFILGEVKPFSPWKDNFFFLFFASLSVFAALYWLLSYLIDFSILGEIVFLLICFLLVNTD